MRTRGPPPSTYTQDYYDYKSEYTQDYPPMPAYNQAYSQHQGQQGAHYNQSMTTFVADEPQHPNAMYDDDQASTTHLALSAAPFAQQPERTGSALQNPYGSSGMNGSYVADPHDVYQGRAIPGGDFTRRSPLPQSEYAHQAHSGMGGGRGYGADVQDYPNPTHPQLPHSQFGAVHSQTLTPEDNYSAYDYEGQGHTEQGYHGHGGGGYVSHAL